MTPTGTWSGEAIPASSHLKGDEGILPGSIDEVSAALESRRYVADRQLSIAIHLAFQLHRPLLLEGGAGVGKTEVAKVIASVANTELIRLQCYEGLDVSQALYQWDYARQMLAIRLMEASETADIEASDIMSRDYLVARPLLRAIEAGAAGRQAVLLVDELDRADEEFEAYLLELLSDFQVSIPEVATIRAEVPPIVIITSNRTREIHDALKRRCLYHWIDYPSYERELKIVLAKSPDLPERLAGQLALAMQRLRQLDLVKPPGVAETLDWARALTVLGHHELDAATVEDTLGVVLKYKEDITTFKTVGIESFLESV